MQEATAKDAAKSSKTHGYLPLFIAQFLFLALYFGGITLAFFLPESQSKQIEAVSLGYAALHLTCFDFVLTLF